MSTRTIGYWTLTVLGAAALLFLVGWLLVGGWAMSPGMMPWVGGVGWPAMMLMMLAMLLFWVAVILAVIWLVRWIVEQAGRGRSEDVGPDAHEIIRRRYARGEISREEYERLRQDLNPKT